MKKSQYIPARGDIIWLDHDPTKGKEQRGSRPVVVLTDKKYNQFGLLISVPITTKMKGYMTEIDLPDNLISSGVILTNHLRTHDWQHRNIQYIERISAPTIEKINKRIRALLHL